MAAINQQSSLLNLSDDGFSFGLDVEVEDNGDTITIRRGSDHLIANAISTFHRPNGDVAYQLPVWRTLADLPRGTKLPLSDIEWIPRDEFNRRIREAGGHVTPDDLSTWRCR